MRNVTTALLLGCLALAPTIARAQADPADQAAGRALFDEGMALLTKGDLAAACPKFEASLRRFPGIGTRGKLAECYERQGRAASAWATYREVAGLAERAGDTTRAKVAAERAKTLEGKLARVTVAAPSPSELPGLRCSATGPRSIPGARLRRGGRSGRTPSSERAGARRWSREVRVGEAESVRVDVRSSSSRRPTRRNPPRRPRPRPRRPPTRDRGLGLAAHRGRHGQARASSPSPPAHTSA